MSKNCPACHRKNLDNATVCWICGTVLHQSLSVNLAGETSVGNGSVYSQAIAPAADTPTGPGMGQPGSDRAVRVLGILGSTLMIITASLLFAMVIFCFLIVSAALSIFAMLSHICS